MWWTISDWSLRFYRYLVDSRIVSESRAIAGVGGAVAIRMEKCSFFLINNQPRGWKLGTKITTFSLLSCGVLVFPARWDCLRCWEARNFGSTFVVFWRCSFVRSPFFTSKEKIKIIPLGQPQQNLWTPASTPWGTGLSGKVWLYASWESQKFWQHFCCTLALLLSEESYFLPPQRKSRLFHLANPKKNYQLPLLHLGGLNFPARWGCLRYGWEKNLGSTFVVIWFAPLSGVLITSL